MWTDYEPWCTQIEDQVRVKADELNMNRKTVRQIVKEDLGMRKISAKMVPQILKTHDQKQRQLHISSDLLCNAEMFDKVITGDEMTRKQNDTASSGKHRIQFGQKKHARLGRR